MFTKSWGGKKVQLEEHIKKENHKLKEFQEYSGVYGHDQLEEIRNRIERLNDDLKVRQESIDLLKGRVVNQIMGFKETIAKVLDSNTSLAEKIQTLFREQGITIASVLMAIGMTIKVLVEALMPGGGYTVASGGPPPKDEKGLKEWIRSKLSLSIATREISSESSWSSAWYHWSDHQLDT